MGSLLFSPSGRIGSSEFMKGAIILIIIGAIIQLSGLVSYKLSLTLSMIGLVTIWCWVVLWVKRFHDGGKSGWMSLVVILVWIVIAMIISVVLMPILVPSMEADKLAMSEAMQAAGQSGDMGLVISTMMEYGDEMAKKSAISNALMSAVIAGAVAYVANMLIKHDPNDNQYGPSSEGSFFD